MIRELSSWRRVAEAQFPIAALMRLRDSGIGTGNSPSTFDFPCQYHSAIALFSSLPLILLSQ